METLGFDSAASAMDPLNRYAQNIIESYHNSLGIPGDTIPNLPDPSQLPSQHASQQVPRLTPEQMEKMPPLVPITTQHALRVGIVGGGIGGLYAALLLQEFNAMLQELKFLNAEVSYEILEASGRLGGRLYTYHFDTSKEYDYYDVGAMRFPDTPIMKPVFSLFQMLQSAGKIQLLDYYFKDRDGKSAACYNDKTVTRSVVEASQDPWNINYWKSLTKYAVQPFLDALVNDVEKNTNAGWALMMKYDKYSMRVYMLTKRTADELEDGVDPKLNFPYSSSDVRHCETFDMSTGGFDRALTEVVLDFLAFGYDGDSKKKINWYCIRGGSSKIAEALDKYMSERSGYTSPVTSAQVTRIAKPPGRKVEVTLSNGSIRCYDHVITTTTLPCLRVVNLDDAGLSDDQKEALRCLQYGPAVKVGVRFKSVWWEDKQVMADYAPYGFGPIIGGQSYTDKMARTVVYPSYGNKASERSSVLIVSYARSMDALALGALFGTESRAQLRRRMLEDLVSIHGFNSKGAKFLDEQWEDVYPYSWSNDPNTMGAFGFFGPDQFSYLYRTLTSPAAGGRLHFAGEGLSVRHGWVVGALQSSRRAVFQVILESLIQWFMEIWKNHDKRYDEWDWKGLAGQSLIALDPEERPGETVFPIPKKPELETTKVFGSSTSQSTPGLLPDAINLPPYV